MIEFKNVSKHFGYTTALDHVNFAFPAGKISGLFGPNGAGKSTIIKMVAGLNYPDSGELLIDGEKPRNSRARVALLPEIDYLYPTWTLRKSANFIKMFYEDWDPVRFQELVKFLNIEEEMVVGKISKGQRAKCKLALVLSRKAPYLLLDEPFSGIDILTRDEIVDALIRDYQAGEQAVIISTHEIDEIESLVEHVVFIDQGRIQLLGDAEEIRNERGQSLVEVMKGVFKYAKR